MKKFKVTVERTLREMVEVEVEVGDNEMFSPAIAAKFKAIDIAMELPDEEWTQELITDSNYRVTQAAKEVQ